MIWKGIGVIGAGMAGKGGSEVGWELEGEIEAVGSLYAHPTVAREYIILNTD